MDMLAFFHILERLKVQCKATQEKSTSVNTIADAKENGLGRSQSMVATMCLRHLRCSRSLSSSRFQGPKGK